ncbi:MAG: nicotinate (nicotinamide) nucleotide adenylyltransferase [Clostridia bacterium]|nr:nicotinate (nicotinamide) nucleotide adenylyltransferase [Clostridia bacterium]
MKIGLYGGAFDPVHNGHVAVMRAAHDEGIEKIILIPCGNMPHKRSGAQTDAQSRIDMLSLAAEDMPYCEISSYEIQKSEVSYSADTVEYFASVYDKDEIHFIVGADSYDYIKDWHQPERIFASSKVVVFPREGYERQQGAQYINMAKVNVSSSEIREKIKLGQDVSNLLPKRVLEYIINNGLYK